MFDISEEITIQARARYARFTCAETIRKDRERYAVVEKEENIRFAKEPHLMYQSLGMVAKTISQFIGCLSHKDLMQAYVLFKSMGKIDDIVTVYNMPCVQFFETFSESELIQTLELFGGHKSIS